MKHKFSKRIVAILLTLAMVLTLMPMTFAELAKAPARTKIQIISIICSVEAPLEKVDMRWCRGRPPLIMTA